MKTIKKKPLIGIIGGKGRMGNWFKSFFEKHGLRVIVSDKNTKLSNIDLAKKADIVIVSVPIVIAPRVIKEVKDHLKKTSLLTDITSLKTETAKAMAEAKCSVLGMHPLFGPLAIGLEKQNIIFCRIPSSHKKNEWIKFLRDFFIGNGAKIIEVSPQEHDYQMAFLQSLVHFSNISLSHFFFKKRFNPELSLLTPVFKLQSLVIGRILAQNPRLYADIEMKNPYFKKLLKGYLEEIISLQKDIEEENYIEFEKKFKQAKSYLSNFIKISEEKTSGILKILERQPIRIGVTKKINIKKSKIGYLGPTGTFSWAAAQKISPSSCTLKPFLTIGSIFEAVNNSDIDFGIVPIQNAIAGIVSETMHAFIDYPVYALGSFQIPIHHCLLSREKSLKEIRVIRSHPQALSQCRIWLEKKLPSALKIPTSSTVAPILEKKRFAKTGFIAPIAAAGVFGLNVLAKNIEDTKENFTRFFIIARELDKEVLKKIKIKSKNTLFLLSVYDRPGVLRDILNIFANRKINLSSLHSIPSYFHSWDYLFFLEIEKSYFSPSIKAILKELTRYCPFVRILGIS